MLEITKVNLSVHIKIRFTIEKETIENSLYIHTTNSVKHRNYGERVTILPYK